MRRVIAPLALGVVLLGVAVTVGLIRGSERDFLIVCGTAVLIVGVIVVKAIITETNKMSGPIAFGWPTRERQERLRRYAETGEYEPEADNTREFIMSALPWLLAAVPCGVAALFYIAL